MEAPGRSFARRPGDGDATTSYLKGIVQQRIKHEKKHLSGIERVK